MTATPLLASTLAPIPGILDLLGQSGPMAIVVLGILGLLSIVSWAIMIERWRRFRKAERESRALRERLSIEPELGGAREFARNLGHSPLAALYTAFSEESDRLRARGLLATGGRPGADNPGSAIDGRARSALLRILEKSAMLQRRRFQRLLGFLATTATVAPFIGLFGTVWGIMNAFRTIGAVGGASIAAYAPGISEALVTTAAGLAAAIPAVAGYNYFVAGVRHIDDDMDDFASDLLQRVETSPPTRVDAVTGR
jgi:biopolymer transport protein TolQ